MQHLKGHFNSIYKKGLFFEKKTLFKFEVPGILNEFKTESLEGYSFTNYVITREKRFYKFVYVHLQEKPHTFTLDSIFKDIM